MSLYDDIRKRIVECMKSGDTIERDTLKTLVGEIQAKVAREKISGPSDEMVEKTLMAFKEGAYQCTLESAKKAHPDACVDVDPDSDRLAWTEISIYEKFLPQYMDVDEIVSFLEGSIDSLQSAKAVGPATGMAMGILKRSGAKVQGKDVVKAVELIRGIPQPVSVYG
jgi:ethanolamine utilization protein EutQ (cupin superfamily)